MDSSSPLVFAHYILANRPPNGSYENDFRLAQNAGIDAFAVMYGGINSNFAQLQSYLANIYVAAQNTDFKIFISIDTTSVNDSISVVKLLNTFSSHPAQLLVDNKIAFSSFSTTPPSWNWQTDILDRVFTPVYFIPGSTSTNATSLFSLPSASAILSWPQTSLDASTQESLDSAFASQRNASSIKWTAGISPWLFERLNAAQNTANAQDDAIFIDRWIRLLKLQPDSIDIVSWNDWSDSSYIGPADTANSVSAAYWDTLDHSAFLSMARVFIKAFKARQMTVMVERGDEDVFFFYRLQPSSVNGALDNLPLPLDWNALKDDVYVVPFLNSSAEIELTSGVTRTHINGTVGVSKRGVSWGLGAQKLTAGRNGKAFLLKNGTASISSTVKKYNGNVVAL
ncbi:hypothetical protein MMC20_004205 [Loxospora ochrophaea]|nr:hypothetical protein [Loxospora ochrophaea]